MGDRPARAWPAVVAVSTAALVALVAWSVMVDAPARTVSSDLGLLYGAMDATRWTGLAVTGVVWLAGVAGVAALAVRVGRTGGPGASLRRAAALAGALGLVAVVSPVVPGFPVGLGWYTLAEQLGVAPATATTSPLEEAVPLVGGLLLVVCVVCVVLARITRTWDTDTSGG